MKNGAEWFCGMRAISCVPAPWIICTAKYNLFKLYVCTTDIEVRGYSGHDTHAEAEWARSLLHVSAADLDKQIKH